MRKAMMALVLGALALGALAGDFPPYKPVGYDTGIRDQGTGYFRVKQFDNGRWWVIDPVGRGVVLLGVDHVTYHGHYCEKLQAFPHLAEMQKKFPNEEDWRVDAIGRLQKWGFNLLGAGSSEDLKHRGLLHTFFLSMGDSWAYEKDENFYICPNENRPCSAFPNVFHPDWPRHCDEVAAKLCAPNREDPWLFGYFIDNELAWWGRSHEWGTSTSGLFDEAMKKQDGHPAKVAALKLASARGVKPGEQVPEAVKREFLEQAAELYFSATSAAIRKADPNHVVMGARFAGISGANPLVWKVSGKYCDLVTFNCYPWADLDRNVVLNDAWSRKEPVAEAFARVYSWVQKPLLVTEWSFPALDSGLPCTQGAGQRFRTQTERTAATELFAKTMLALPYMLGYDYFMWVDEPALGISQAFPENTNYGLINEKGDAYPEITAMFENLHRNLGKWREAPVPAERKVEGDDFANYSVKQATQALANAQGKVQVTEGAAYSLRTDAGLVLEGKLGSQNLFDRVALGDVDYGRFTFMVDYAVEPGDSWCEIRKVESVRKIVENGEVTGLALRAYGESFSREFTVEVEFKARGDSTRFLANLVKVENVGKQPLEIKMLLFRAYPNFLGESTSPEEVPTLWKGAKKAAWIARDGRVYGAYSFSPLASNFYFWKEGAAPHPDAGFALQRTLQPGASWNPEGKVYITAVVDFGGSSIWRKATEVR